MLKIALVGFGWWGNHIANRLSTNNKLNISAVVETDESLHGKIESLGLKAETDLDSVLASKEIEAVVLTSPNNLHDSHVAAAVSAGKHVFCEKPLSLSPDGARKSVKICQDAGLVLGVGHERRWEPAVQQLKQMLEEGVLGTIMHAEMAFSHNKLNHLPSGSWRTSKIHAPAAGMTQMGIHLTDLLIWFFGKVDSISAVTTSRSLGWETGDVVSVQLTFESGMTATLQAILDTPHFIRTHVFGSAAWIEIRNDTHPDTPGGLTGMEVYRSKEDRKVSEFKWFDSVVANLESFASAILDGTQYPYTAFELVHNIEVLEAIIQSSQTNKVVVL